MSKKVIIFDFDGVIADTAEISFSIHKHFFLDITKEEWVGLSLGNIYENKHIVYTPEIKKGFDEM